MAHYKKDAASNRNALFGGSSGGGSAAAPSRINIKPSSAVAAAAPSAAAMPISTAINSSSSSNADDGLTPGPSSLFSLPSSSRHSNSHSSPLLNQLTGSAKLTKLAEAESHRASAKKAMTSSFFSKPDPISAANYYKRAAEAYQQCGEVRLEKLHRIACGDCQLGMESYATAAVEYSRAAELAELSGGENGGEESLERRRKECYKLHCDAANAYAQMGERGRYAESLMKGAFGLVMGSKKNEKMEERATLAVEGAVEAFCGDPLNRMRDYRRTGVSMFASTANVGEDGHGHGGGSSSGALDKAAYELAKQQVVLDAYAHETLFKVAHQFISRRQYESALYAHGAGTAILELEGYATVSLYRAYLSETILLLAMGDGVAASHEFKNVHLQNTSYLSSRECALEEDLIRAVESMDMEALELARSKESGVGQHRSAMASLDPIMRELIMEIRVSGRAKKEKMKNVLPATASKAAVAAAAAVSREIRAKDERPSSTTSTTPRRQPPSELTESALVRDTDAGFEEMDDIMNQMGLNDDDDNVGGGGDDDDDDDDEFDLR